MVRQDNTYDYSVGKLHPLSKRADCRSKYSNGRFLARAWKTQQRATALRLI